MERLDKFTETQGRILHLQRLSTEDGPGIRTTVFFKGCPLSCGWCHNPESISVHPQIQWYPDRCLGCDTCLSTCTIHALTRSDGQLIIDRESCSGCGDCAECCPANALELLGRQVTVKDLIQELTKDRVFFEKSAGGVTLSGGEPGIQSRFAYSLMSNLRDLGITTALDTCGLLAEDVLVELLQETDVLLFDVKLIDEDAHIRFTGQSNRIILSNLKMVANRCSHQGSKYELWIRTPLIPGATATDQNIAAIGKFLKENLEDCISRWELCAFNNLCRDKYNRLGMKWEYSSQALLSKGELEHFQEVARACGLPAERVKVTGAAQADK